MVKVDQIWESYHAPLKKFIVGKTRNAAAADDILQNVFLKILTHLHDLKQQQKLKAWMYQITRNAIIDYYRKEKPTDELPFDLPEQIEHGESNLNQEFSACVKPFLEQLPKKYREALVLTEFKGYSQKQMSDMLQISVSGAKSRVQRGRLKLKELLQACCHFELDRYGNILDIAESSDKSVQTLTCGCEALKGIDDRYH